MLNRNNTKSGIVKDFGIKFYFILGQRCGAEYPYSNSGFDSFLDDKLLIEKTIYFYTFNETNFVVRSNITGREFVEICSFIRNMMKKDVK